MDRLLQLVETQYRAGNCGSVALAVSTDDGKHNWSGGAGPRSLSDARPMTGSSPYFIASATKLYTTAILLQLVDEGALRLADRVAQLIPKINLAGIHVLNGVDHSGEITVQHMMAHTSGLADYFEQKKTNGASLMDGLVAGDDRAWTLDDVLEISRAKVRPKFAPGTQGKALYSDTNFQLLGALIESLTGASYAQNVTTRVTRPLALSSTYVFSPKDLADYDSIAAMKQGDGMLRIPLAMSSFGPDGGIVSPADESIVFLKAFFQGALFQKRHLDEIQVWNRIFFPLRYGIGVMKFQLPRFFSPFKPFPVFLGHSGASGTVMFYCPAQRVYICGTVNQAKHRDLPYRMMLKVLSALPKDR